MKNKLILPIFLIVLSLILWIFPKQKSVGIKSVKNSIPQASNSPSLNTPTLNQTPTKSLIIPQPRSEDRSEGGEDR